MSSYILNSEITLSNKWWLVTPKKFCGSINRRTSPRTLITVTFSHWSVLFVKCFEYTNQAHLFQKTNELMFLVLLVEFFCSWRLFMFSINCQIWQICQISYMINAKYIVKWISKESLSKINMCSTMKWQPSVLLIGWHQTQKKVHMYFN